MKKPKFTVTRLSVLELEVPNFPGYFSANKPAASCEGEWLKPRLAGGVSRAEQTLSFQA